MPLSGYTLRRGDAPIFLGNPATATPANLSNAAVQGSLVVCIEHMASLCSFASHIFSEIVKEASTTYQRVETLRGRVQDAVQLLPTVEDTFVKSSTEVLFNNQRSFFASATNEGAQLFTKDNRTNSINQTYGRAEKPPSFSRVNPYMENNMDALKLYSNPEFFLEQWIEEQMRIREANKKLRAQKKAAKAKKAQTEDTKSGVVQVAKMVVVRYDKDTGQKIIEEVPQVAAHSTVQSQLTYAEGGKPIDFSHANVPAYSSPPPVSSFSAPPSGSTLRAPSHTSYAPPAVQEYIPPPPTAATGFPSAPQYVAPPQVYTPPPQHSQVYPQQPSQVYPQQAYTSAPQALAAPTAPAAPAPPPPPSAPAPPPPPSGGGGGGGGMGSLAGALGNVSLNSAAARAKPVDERSSLLNQIKLGANLKSAQTRAVADTPAKEETNSVASILARRIAIAGSDSESDEEDNEEWD
ncbi:hypothetical protein PROFUN_12258 [Planoprotostelium fungivorum]|uniref:WASP family protein member n=1 Tax=Planoprotostelium fungivorum TaxID=1890364 RepID=A0A2P6N834_9EUKA|nr:hypothetical protein PROFUN_12258 [Planoprotostelium fungivorum]